MAHISIYCGFCFWLPSDARASSLTSFEAQSLLLRLNNGLAFPQSAFWILITKPFSLVLECNVFLQRCITLGSARHLQIQNYKTEVQLKPKLSDFPKIV